MAMLDQQRASLAFKHVAAVKNDRSEPEQKKYASIVHSMPSLLRSAGLSQALHFVASRSSEDQRIFLDHLAPQLKRIDPAITDAAKLLNAVRTADLPMYLRLTNEALACSSWYRRLVQGLLKIEAGGDDDK